MFFSSDTSHTVVQDTVKQANSGGDWILHHVMDGNYLDFEPFGKIYLPHLQLLGLDISITRHVVFLWIVAALLILTFVIASKSYKKSLVPHGFTNFIETIIVFVRDEIVKPTIGHGYEKFLPYLLTAFFFILYSNFLGLIPYTATVTSNIAVTATLAGFTFITTQIGGMISHGPLGYFKGLIPPGMPVALLPLIVLVEIFGLFTKPFALCIRLFANMTAGHVVILSLIGLIFIMKTIYFAPVSIAFALFIYFLELLVALIQAYIFTMLSSLFIGMAVHQDH
ncbi:MAG: ATP synthase F0 subunit A [Ignavibacteria bacterium RBG_16_35_7]|nr:MAG: ATP synthase F0 subunit A [Ignavibacteria bacterium RBG_16_35_7]